MKSFNRSPDHQKWGLYLLLLGSLGFTLSMNPDHFNNIVRNDIENSGVFELAQEDAKAAPEPDLIRERARAQNTPAVKDDKAQAPEDATKTADQGKQKTKVMSLEELKKEMASIAKAENAATQEQLRELNKKIEAFTKLLPADQQDTTQARPQVAGQAQAAARTGGTDSGPANAQAAAGAPAASNPNDPRRINLPILGSDKKVISCEAEVKKEGADTKATITSKTEAGPCKPGKTYSLKSSATDSVQILAEEILQKIAADTSDKSEKDLEKEKMDKIKAEYDSLVKSNCRKKGMDYSDKLECVQNLLSAMSDKLDDSNASKLAVKNFFSKYVLPEIRSGMNAPTVSFDPFGRPLQDTSKLDAANDSALYLLEHLNVDNSDGITQLLGKVRAGSYSTQAGYARNLYLEAQDDKKDPMRWQIGMMKENIAKANLNPTTLNWLLARDSMSWNNALNDGGKSSQQSLLQSGFYNPVRGFISQLPKMDMYGKLDANKQDLAAQQLAAMNFGDLSGMGMSSPGLGTPFTPGTGISQFPLALLDSRQNGQRGLDIPLISQARGVGQGNNRSAQGQQQQVQTQGKVTPTTGTGRSRSANNGNTLY